MPAPGPDPLVVLRVALELKLLSRPQVEDCAKTFNAEGAKRPIAEILIEKGYIAPEAVRRVISVAEERAGPPAGEFLKIAATLKILDGARVQEAVSLIQATRRGDASEILVSNGFLTAGQAEKVRQTWKAARAPAAAPPPEPAPAVLLQVAIAEGLLTKAQAIQCISLVKKSGGKKPLSRILVEQGMLDETQAGGILKLAREGKKTSRKRKEEVSAAARASTALRRRSVMESVRARQAETPEGEAKPGGMGRRLLAAALAGLVVLGGGGAAGYFFWWKPNHTPKPPTPPVVDNGGPVEPPPEQVMDRYTEDIGALNGELAQANTLADVERLADQFRALRDRLDAETRLSERQARRAADKLFKLERGINTARQNKLDDLRVAHDGVTRTAERLERAGRLRELRELLVQHDEEHGDVDAGCRGKIEDWTREIDEILGPFERLVDLEGRALEGPLSEAELAEARGFLGHAKSALAWKAESVLVRHHIHSLDAAMREAVERRRAQARERIAAAQANPEAPPEAPAAGGSIFESLTLPTCLDDLLERMPEETAGPVGKLRTAIENLRNLPGNWLERGARSEAVVRFTLEDLDDPFAGFAPYHYWYAAALSEAESYQEALPRLQRALVLIPDYPEAHVLLGRLHMDLGDFDEADRAFDRATELAGDISSIYFFRALKENYTNPRDPAPAERFLEQGLRLNPGGARDAFLLQQVLGGPLTTEWQGESIYEQETEHYYVRSNVSQEMADRCAQYLEWHRPVYAQILRAVGRQPSGRVKPKVYIFKDQQKFMAYSARTGSGADPNVLGYYHPLYREFLFYELQEDPEGKKTLGVLVHEGFHQYAREVLPNIPRWINESMAELSQGTAINPDTGEILEMAVISDLLRQDRLPWIKRQIDDLRSVTLDTHWLENGDWNYFHFYASGWTLMMYLFKEEEGRYRTEYLDKYLAALAEGKSIRDAFYAAFPGGRRNHGWITDRWKQWVRDVILPQVPEETPPPPEQPDVGPGD